MIIGLAGKAGAGKDEIARHLVIHHGFTRVAFADNVKALALKLNPQIDTSDGTRVLSVLVALFGWEGAKQEQGVREFLQALGNGVREVLGDHVWIEAVEQTILATKDVVITDMRYANEIALIGSMGGKLVRVERPGLADINDHVSEHQWRGLHFTETLVNDGTLDELYTKASALVS